MPWLFLRKKCRRITLIKSASQHLLRVGDLNFTFPAQATAFLSQSIISHRVLEAVASRIFKSLLTECRPIAPTAWRPIVLADTTYCKHDPPFLRTASKRWCLFPRDWNLWLTNILLCVSAPTLDKLKIWRRQILTRFLVKPNKFCQSNASGPIAVLIRNKSGFVIDDQLTCSWRFLNTFIEQALSLFTNFSFLQFSPWRLAISVVLVFGSSALIRGLVT